MRKLWRKFMDKLLNDDVAVERWARSILLTFGGGGIAFAQSLAEELGVEGNPTWLKVIKSAAVICLFVGGAITAGEKNEPAAAPEAAPPAPGDAPKA